MLYTIFVIGVKKFIKWVADGDKKNKDRQRKKKKTRKLMWEDRIELQKREDLFGLTLSNIAIFVVCVIIIIYTIVCIP